MIVKASCFPQSQLFILQPFWLFVLLVLCAPRARGVLGGLADTFAGLYDSYVADYVTNQYRYGMLLCGAGFQHHTIPYQHCWNTALQYGPVTPSTTPGTL